MVGTHLVGFYPYYNWGDECRVNMGDPYLTTRDFRPLLWEKSLMSSFLEPTKSAQKKDQVHCTPWN